jgi:cytochrome c heme-lyase
MGVSHSQPGLGGVAAGEGDKCPVSKGSRDALAASAAAAAKSSGGAPLSKERLSGPVYNVYNTVIDPTNMMPPPNQSPAPGQTVPLPVERVVSSIPKGGTSGTWLYPSPQMFYNSLVRKNKADGVDVPDVNIVVAIHNEMNERTWAQLKEWEALHAGEHAAGQPSLRRFMGNPHQLSPKSRIKSWLGYGFPFDRHDWFVDRGEEQVRSARARARAGPNTHAHPSFPPPNPSFPTGALHNRLLL